MDPLHHQYLAFSFDLAGYLGPDALGPSLYMTRIQRAGKSAKQSTTGSGD